MLLGKHWVSVLLTVLSTLKTGNPLPFDTLQGWIATNRGLNSVQKEFFVNKDGRYAVCNLEFNTDTLAIEKAYVSCNNVDDENVGETLKTWTFYSKIGGVLYKISAHITLNTATNLIKELHLCFTNTCNSTEELCVNLGSSSSTSSSSSSSNNDVCSSDPSGFVLTLSSSSSGTTATTTTTITTTTATAAAAPDNELAYVDNNELLIENYMSGAENNLTEANNSLTNVESSLTAAANDPPIEENNLTDADYNLTVAENDPINTAIRSSVSSSILIMRSSTPSGFVMKNSYIPIYDSPNTTTNPTLIYAAFSYDASV